jgi:hypothetical protein
VSLTKKPNFPGWNLRSPEIPGNLEIKENMLTVSFAIL